MSPITILIADDHASTRAAVRTILELEPDLRIVGEANNGLEALAAVRHLAPDVVLMDHHMPQVDGLETTRRLKAHWPHVAVVFLAGEESGRLAAYHAGAEAYLLKDTPPEVLVTTIRAVARRRRCAFADPPTLSAPVSPAIAA